MSDDRALTECPKCGLEAKTLLHRFCTHSDCPVRSAAPARDLATAPGEEDAYRVGFVSGALSELGDPASHLLDTPPADAGLVEAAYGCKHAENCAYGLPECDCLAPPRLPPDLHPKSACLVAKFSAALATKLALAQRKYEHSDGWAEPGWRESCVAQLAEHVGKGDPLDVAAYAAFCWHHGWSTAPDEKDSPDE